MTKEKRSVNTEKNLNFTVPEPVWRACRIEAAARGEGANAFYAKAVEREAKRLKAEREASGAEA